MYYFDYLTFDVVSIISRIPIRVKPFSRTDLVPRLVRRKSEQEDTKVVSLVQNGRKSIKCIKSDGDNLHELSKLVFLKTIQTISSICRPLN